MGTAYDVNILRNDAPICGNIFINTATSIDNDRKIFSRLENMIKFDISGILSISWTRTYNDELQQIFQW